MTEKTLPTIQSSFEGCLLGGLVGDCFGYPFENEMSHHYSAPKIQQLFDSYLTEEDEESDDGEKDILQYTDDTSMTKCVVEAFISLSEKENKLDPVNLAIRFTQNYDNERIGRCYGSHVPTVFNLLKKTNYANPYEPSHSQFNGQGSFGNGSGMRVAPISLFTIIPISQPDSISPLVTNAVIASRITHGNPLGILGGIFQALAVRHALLAAAEKKGKPMEILAAFKSDYESLSSKNPEYSDLYNNNLLSDKAFADYAGKIKVIEMLLMENEGNDKLDVQTIKNVLGVKVEALHSIPTAFFCFLAAFHPISFVPTENQFQRTIQLAVSLGGDTDTIAAMAGNIAGAYLGRDGIPTELIRACEDYENVASLAQKLYVKVASR